ncbi:MAG: SpoIIE family protein phosphatase [Cytophagaceae bacterium]|nr:SpoIIE family protein phosphatase [Cytophagaceae bacterium]
MRLGWTVIIFSIFCFSSLSAYSSRKKSDLLSSQKDQSIAVLIKNGEKLLQEKKYGKAIKEFDKALEAAIKSQDEAARLECYRLLSQSHLAAGNKKKSSEFEDLYTSLKAKSDNEKLQIKEKLNQIEINRLKEQKLRSELGLQKAQTEIEEKNQVLGSTLDSLAALDQLNKETQVKISLLEKEKELKELKVKEQSMQLENKELQLKEQDARLRAEKYIIALLIGGLAFSSIFGLVVYRNFKQRQKAAQKIQEQYETIHHQHQNISNSIQYAQRIQQAMLPQEKALQHFVPDSFVLYKPKDVVSGDFYWFYNVYNQSRLNEAHPEENEALENLPDPKHASKMIIAAVDCTGHGVPGALMSMIGYNLLNEIAHKNIHESNLMLNELHRSVRFALQQYKNDNKDGMDMALCVIDKVNKTLEFTGAKNPLIFIQDHELFVIKGDKEAIGGQGEAKRNYSKQLISIEKPTWIYLFSDGYVDQFGGKDGKKFMIKNFKELLLSIHQKPFHEQKQILNSTIEEWKGTEEKQIDDIMVLGLKVS